MGNSKVSDAEILDWVLKGWNFRVKTSKGRKYITRRKKQVEKSLGPFNEDLWNKINELKKLQEIKPKSNTENIKIIQESINLIRNNIKVIDCVFRDEDRYCKHYFFFEEIEIFKLINKYGAVENFPYKKEDHKVYFKATELFCENCPAYLNREMLSFKGSAPVEG